MLRRLNVNIKQSGLKVFSKKKAPLVTLCIFVITTLTIVSLNNKATSNIDGDKKIIEWGWGTPFPSYVNEHIQEMEELPFDGLVFDLELDKQAEPPYDNFKASNRFSWTIWGTEALKLENYSESVQALNNINSDKFTDNFLRVNVTPGNVDWYDDEFESVTVNANLAAQIAKSAGLVGFFFDTEPYQGKLFHYPSQKYNQKYSFTEYRQQVQKRGREFMKAINQAYPDIKILLTFAYSKVNSDPLREQLYGLLPAFLDGMLEAASSETIIYDGFELSYGYKNSFQFRRAYQRIYSRARQLSDLQDLQGELKQHYRASFGLWIDKDKNWDQKVFRNNYYQPEEFKEAVRAALRSSDRYVWVYSQKAQWWNDKIPQLYINALSEARN